jgi:hypothetical protein
VSDTTITSFVAGERLLKQKSDRLPDVREGDTVHVSCSPASVHLFDRASGARL